jgi:hypothetical protein
MWSPQSTAPARHWIQAPNLLLTALLMVTVESKWVNDQH